MPVPTITMSLRPAQTIVTTGDLTSALEALRDAVVAHSTHWAVTDYVAGVSLELRPLKVANQNDRLAIFPVTGAVVGAMAIGNISALGTVSFISAYAVGAGTTGPEQLPTVGNPYPSFPCTRCIGGMIVNVSINTVQFLESEDTIEFAMYGSASSTVSFMWAGYNIHTSADQLAPSVVGGGSSIVVQDALTASATTGQLLWNIGSGSTPNNTHSLGSYIPVGGGVGDFSLIVRTNGVATDKARFSAGSAIGLMPVGIMQRNSGYVGNFRQHKIGPRTQLFNVVSDGTGILGYAWSYSAITGNGSTMYSTNVQ